MGEVEGIGAWGKEREWGMVVWGTTCEGVEGKHMSEARVHNSRGQRERDMTDSGRKTDIYTSTHQHSIMGATSIRNFLLLFIYSYCIMY